MKRILPLLLLLCLLLAACVQTGNGAEDTGNPGGVQENAVESNETGASADMPDDTAKETDGPLTLYPALLQLPLGQHVTLEAKPEGKALTWSSSNPSAATVDGNGRITPVAEGETIITVTLADDASITAACGVLVTAEGNIFLWE